MKPRENRCICLVEDNPWHTKFIFRLQSKVRRMERKVLHYVDYIVFGLSLAISLAIGIYYSRSAGKQRSVEEYLMGNRRITCFPVALSLLVTFQSGISLLGLPVEIYYYGTQIYMGIIGLVIGYIIVAAFIVPVLHPLQITSVYEVRKKIPQKNSILQMRFS